MMNALLARYGQELSLTDEAGAELRRVRGFVQPLHFGEQSGCWEETPGGGIFQGRYLLIAGEEAFAGAGAERFVICAGARYRVLRADRLDAILGEAHWEAVLCREGGAKI